MSPIASSFLLLGFSLFGASRAANVTYDVPCSVPAGSAALAVAPVGVSFEFFTFPSYFTNVSATTQCLKNFEALTGTWPPIRIGGTTQDRAQYDATTSAYVVYTVAKSVDAPAALTFGSSFMTLAATYAGTVVLGLNRGYNNLSNTIAAAKVAKAKMANLLAIELGNEPEYWTGDGQAITNGTAWTPALDSASEDNWDIAVGSAIETTNIIQAINSNSHPSDWGATRLIATENATARSYVHDYAMHYYPGGTVPTLMDHSLTATYVATFDTDSTAARAIGKEYVFGETNSVTGGGAAAVSPTFGAALWVMDHSLRAASSNITRAYFHHGTLGACSYCWWGVYDVASPYYGAYFATAAMASGLHIAALDAGNTNYAVYVIYDSSNKPLRAVLYNSDYYETGTRSSETFTLTGLKARTVTAKRLTASNALSRVDEGSNPTFGGQEFSNGTCSILGNETFETTTVTRGKASFTVAASEALLVYLQ